MQHPVFGTMRFIPVGDDEGYWEAEGRVEGAVIDVLIEAGKEGPTEAHVEFFLSQTASLDELFAQAAPVLVPDFEMWMNGPFPENWREAFRFIGLTVPKNGDPANPWDISYDCIPDKSGHIFTAYHKDGKWAFVTIDG